MSRNRSTSSEFRIACLLGFGVSLWFVLFMGYTPETHPGASKIQDADKPSLSQFLASRSDSNCQDGFCRTDSSEENSGAPHDLPILIHISISPESRVKASAVAISPSLAQEQWTEYVIAIENSAGVKSWLSITSDQFVETGKETADRWLRAELISNERLTGAPLEYRTVRLWSCDAGKRAAVLAFSVGQGTQDLGFRSDVLILFDVKKRQRSIEQYRKQ